MTNNRSLNAARVSRHHFRRKQGRSIYRIEADDGALIDLLIRKKYLAEWDATDRAAVQQALEKLIEFEANYQMNPGGA